MAHIDVLHHNYLIEKFNKFTIKGKEHFLIDLHIDYNSYEKALKQGFDPELHESLNKSSKIYVFHNNINEYKHYSEL